MLINAVGLLMEDIVHVIVQHTRHVTPAYCSQIRLVSNARGVFMTENAILQLHQGVHVHQQQPIRTKDGGGPQANCLQILDSASQMIYPQGSHTRSILSPLMPTFQITCG